MLDISFLRRRLSRISTRGDLVLLEAILEPDEEVALQAAALWLEQVPVTQITDAHHRLLAGISRRHGSAPALAKYRKLLRRIERQLWVRAAASISELGETLAQFDRMHLPYFLHGNALWHIDGTPILNDLETIDIMVPDEGYQYAISKLWSRGWQPGRSVNLLFAPNPMELARQGFSHIRVRTDSEILRTLSSSELWGNMTLEDFFGLQVCSPSKGLWTVICEMNAKQRAYNMQAHIDIAEIGRRRGALKPRR